MADRDEELFTPEEETPLVGYKPAPINWQPKELNPAAPPPPNSYKQGFGGESVAARALREEKEEKAAKTPAPAPAPDLAPAVPAAQPKIVRGANESPRDFLQRRLGRQLPGYIDDTVAAQMLSQETDETPLVDTPRPATGTGGPAKPDRTVRMMELLTGQEQTSSPEEEQELQTFLSTPQGRVAQYNLRVGELQRVGREQQERLMAAEAAGAEQEQRLAEEKAVFDKGARNQAQLRQLSMEVARQKHLEQIAKADKAVDEFRIGDDRSIADRIASGIIAALGALGAGLTGQPNYALEILEKNIDRRIDAQKAELQKRKEGAAGARNDLAEYLNHFGNMEQAAEQLRVRYLREYADGIEKVKASTKTKQAKDTLGTMQTELLLKAQQDQDKALIDAEMAGLMAARRASAGAPVAKPPGFEDDPNIAFVNAETAGRWDEALHGFIMPTNNARLKADIQDYRQYVGAEQLADQIIEAANSPKQPGVSTEWDPEAARLTSLISVATQQWSSSEGGGVITKDDIFKKTLDNPAEWLKTRETAVAKAQVMKQRALQRKAELRRHIPITYADKPKYQGTDENGNMQYVTRIHDDSPEELTAQRKQAAQERGRAGAPTDEEAVRLEQRVLEYEGWLEKQRRQKKSSKKGGKKSDDSEPEIP